jgi:hypothetical protein
MSALGLAALAVAQADLAAGVRGGQPGRFQSPEVAARLAAVYVASPEPWCAAEVAHCFDVAREAQDVARPQPGVTVNACPRTASALHIWKNAPVECRRPMPFPGAVFVVVHADGIHGHCGIVESCSPDGQTITTIEGDTNAAGSSAGDAMGRHLWRPADGARGRLVGYLEFGA